VSGLGARWRRPVGSRAALWLLLLAFALAAQGTRGLWEPDEGFYGATAGEMFDAGEWLVPRLQGHPFLDKPPLVYWSGIAGMRLLGRNEWGLRLGHAIALLLAALAIGGIARTLWDRRTGDLATVVYVTSLGPFLAANVLTPDTLLAAAVAGFYLGYVRAETAESPRERRNAWLLAGFAAGLGLLAKGPAMLLFAAPLVVDLFWRRRALAVLRQPGPWLGALVALVLGLSWYAWIVRTLPGALAYILDSEVVGRLAGGNYERNARPWGGLEVYLPTLVALSLPWGPLAAWAAWRRRRERAAVGVGARPDPVGERPLVSVVVLWFFLPLAVLLFARSRLPLYALPLAGPLALASARALALAPESRSDRARLARRLALAAWCALLLAVKLGAAIWPADQDSRRFAVEIVAAAGGPDAGHFDVVAVDARRRALGFYLDAEVEQVRGFQPDYPFFSKLEQMREEIDEARASGERTIFIFQREHLDLGLARLAGAGLGCSPGASTSRRHAIVVCGGLRKAEGQETPAPLGNG